MEFTIYFDFKSPYAYLAKDLLYAVEDDLGVAADWRYYSLDIPSYLGMAKVDEQGNVIESTRTAHQWRKVKYGYMDLRRHANYRGLTILGTQKIWDSSLAGIGFYWAKQQGRQIMRAYIDRVFEPFWKRALDIEDMAVILAELQAAGADTSGFEDWAAGEGRALHDQERAEAEARGVFGVATVFLDDEMFFGRENIPLIRWKLQGGEGNWAGAVSV